MFSFFSQKMDGDQGGELGDIIRGSNGYDGPPAMMSTTDWKFLPLTESISFPSSAQVSSGGCFGDPFSYSGRDPLLDELPAPKCSDSSNGGFLKLGTKVGMNGQVGDGSGTSASALVATDQKMQGFLQFSPTSRASPVLTRGLIRPPPIVVDGHVMKMMNSNNISSFLIADHNNLQISSPPRTPGIKRRKSQARKVVCIPAPAAAGSRASGEVVPSDLWAWRKYGQKPIKGSPYPRGYYRCSSSKGCSARKQVERSRTDPNMLVITYTSEHNHPWPTQRNALAGSTRAQSAKMSTSASKSSHQDQKDDQQTKQIAIDSIRAAKEEKAVEIKEPILDDDLDQDVAFSSNYKPMFDELCNSHDLFDIGEFDPDPMDLVYISKGLLDEKTEEQEERQNGSKGVDPFSLFDWAENTIGESKNVGSE